MINRFTKCSNELRDATNKVAIRQAMAHPMSEFLGTIDCSCIVVWRYIDFGTECNHRCSYISSSIWLSYIV
jgi:hypothetical protein